MRIAANTYNNAGNMSGWQIAGNAAMAGMSGATGLGHLGGQAIKKLDGPINLGNGGCFVAGTKVKVDSLPLSGELEAVLAGAAKLREPFATAKPAATTTLLPAAASLQPPVSGLQSPVSSLVPIESVPLGARIGTKNPQVRDYDDSLPEPDSYSWSKIELTISRDDGVVIDVELLRPDQWILDNNVFVGSEIPIHVAELDVYGTATVTALSACPGLAAGDGECVTGRFVTRRVGETVRITLTDGTLLEGTPVHPIWSVDREDFIPLSDLQPGERLQTAAGPQAIASVEIRHLPVPVYNIEVRGQHVYEVSDAGILVHNAQPCLVDVDVRWDNGWRTADGKFATPQGVVRSGATAEAAAWDAVQAKPGWQVIRGEVSVRDATGQLRKYDGAAISASGRIIGLEIKSGSASRTAAQRTFDEALNSSGVKTLLTVGQHSGLQIRRALEIKWP